MMSSGTVGAAMEAALLGKRSIAISFPYFRGPSGITPDLVNSAASVAVAVTRRLADDWPTGAEVVNVNIPLGVCTEEAWGATGETGGIPRDGVEGVRMEWLEVTGHPEREVAVVWTEVARDVGYGSLFAASEHERVRERVRGDGETPEKGTRHFKWEPQGLRVFQRESAKGTDVWAMRKGAVSVTPMRACVAAVGS